MWDANTTEQLCIVVHWRKNPPALKTGGIAFSKMGLMELEAETWNDL